MRFIVATRSKDTADEILRAARDTPDMEVYLGSFEFAPSFRDFQNSERETMNILLPILAAAFAAFCV